MTLVLIASFAVLVGAVIRGYAGFGASMFWVASLSLIYSPASVVPTVLMLEAVASIFLLPSVFRDVQWRSMSWMLAATALTMPFGVALLAVLPERPMRVVVAVAILLGTLAVMSGPKLAGEPGRRSALTAGSISGLINGSTGIGGPPAVLLYFSRNTEAKVGRATLIAYFLATDSIGATYMALYGLVDIQVIQHAAIFAPLALLGTALGQLAFRTTGDRGYRKIVFGVLVALSIAMLVRAVMPS